MTSLFVDLDLVARQPARCWSELHIGGPDGAVIVVTDQPHNGCGKFIARYGKDAMTFVNAARGHSRGGCAGCAPGWCAPVPYDPATRWSSYVPARPWAVTTFSTVRACRIGPCE